MADIDEIGDISKPADDSDAGSLRFSTDRQRKVWLALGKLHTDFGPRIASIYEGIIIALNSDNPEKVSIVSHLARELSTILPIYVSVLPVRQERVRDDQIKKDLNTILSLLGTSDVSDSKVKEIVEGLIAKIPDQLSQREQFKKVLDDHPLLGNRPAYLNEEFVKQWMRVHEYFVKHSHHHELRNQRTGSLSEAELSANWNALEVLIYRVLVKEPFYNAVQEIDRLLKVDAPTEQDADDLMRHIVEQQHRRYFFDKCSNPNWLALLDKRGAFSSPQEPVRKDGYIQYIPWPESKYLARVANAKPAEVYEIIKKLTSENQTVLYDFLKSALESPVDIAAQYADMIIEKKWLQSSPNLRLPYEVAELMEKLAKDGKEGQALRLADVLFSLRADKPLKSSDADGSPAYIHHPDAKPYFDEWQFGEIVKEKTVELARMKPAGLFGVFAQKLKDAIEFEERENPADSLYEYSHIWRPNLLGARNIQEDAKNILVDGLVTLIDQYKDAPSTLIEFVTVLKKIPYALFRRIEMLIYKNHPDEFVAEAEEILRKKEIITAYNLRREYLPLLGLVYTKISPEAQEEILKIVEGGPYYSKREGFTDEEFERVKADWRAQYLAPVKDHLPAQQGEEYTEIIKKYGEPFDDDGEITSWYGGQSPITKEDLSKLSAEDTVQYFVDYKTPNDHFGTHSASGLGMAFAELVADDPQKYVPTLGLFFSKKIRPLYFYHLVHGLKETVKKDQAFEWIPVLDLCYRIIVNVEYPATPLNDDEQDWKSVRLAIADFLGAALGKNNCDAPISEKARVWDMISNLADDPHPTPEDEKRDGEGGLDPMTLAINTVRGEAMHAVVNYGLWIARNLPDKTIEVKVPPEMTALLDKHLDIEQDPSLAIHSVYGWRLPNFFYLNKPWLEANKEKIFDKTRPDYLWAAWEGYLATEVVKDIVPILKNQYKEFIPYLGKTEKTGYRANDVDQRFAQHIAIIYANEPEHEDLVEEFFNAAPAKERSGAINFIGRVILRQIDNFKDKEEVKKRLGRLWDARISLPEEKIDSEEIREFGWWFKVSPFPKKETLDRTIKTLQLIKGVIDVPYEIAEELKSYATEFPVETITVLDLIARAERETYEHLYKKEEYREVIRLVKATGSVEGIRITDELINYFGSIGLIEEFRDLL